jgi:hypothetical protein
MSKTGENQPNTCVSLFRGSVSLIWDNLLFLSQFSVSLICSKRPLLKGLLGKLSGNSLQTANSLGNIQMLDRCLKSLKTRNKWSIEGMSREFLGEAYFPPENSQRMINRLFQEFSLKTSFTL